MTREEAIKKLELQKNEYLDKYIDFAGIADAYDMAIEALSAEPCEDCISRAEALKNLALTTNKDDVYRMLTRLSVVTPKVAKCEDALSRQAVMDAMYELCGEGSLKDNPWRDNPNIDAIIDAIVNLPSVTQKQRMCLDGMTNGEVIQALFPKAEVYVQEWKDFKSIVVWFENAQVSHDFTWDWWNAPYKAENEDKE